VEGTGSFDPEVVWSVEEEGRKPGTGVTRAGLLTVAADESLKTLTVTVVFAADSSRPGRALVTVISGGVPEPEPGTTYKVILNRQDGSGVTAFYGSPMTPVSTPAREGYTLPAGSAPGYIVRFESNGGTETASQTVESGGKGNKARRPRADGYTFAGWYKDNALTTAWNFDTGTATADITLRAKWNIKNYFDLGTETGGWEYDAPVLTIQDGAEVTVFGETTGILIVVEADGEAAVILDGASIGLSESSDASPLTLGSGANLTLRLSGENTLVGATTRRV